MPNSRAPKRKFTLRDLTWTWAPKSAREAGDAVVRNFYLHWFPSKVNKRSISTGYSFWLGTISALLFLLLTLTGVILMFLYVPSVERAYGSVKDLEYAVSYGAFLRAVHRIAAHLMVAAVFLHMVRVFLTSAFKNGVMANQNRPLNWYLGLGLLLITLLLSFTGYLLPWDQLAFWAITVGTNIARAVPLIGEELRFLLLGGYEINQNTLIRFYVLHCAFLPLILTLVFIWHMWRIHKDGGLASHDQTALKQKVEQDDSASSKTYTLLGVSAGTTATVQSALVKDERQLVQSVPGLIVRLLAVGLLTLAVTGALAVWLGAPLEEAANPEITPNPAKAPWYFLWLQELVTITTIRIGGWTLNGALVGGVLIPGLLLLWAFLVPSLDRSGSETVAVWFHSHRRLANSIFLLVCLALVVLTVVAVFMRGPFWDFYWPWQEWPTPPNRV